MKLWKKKKINKEDKIFWFPRISGIIFLFILFSFLLPEIIKLVGNYPLLWNFFFGVVILSAMIMTWRDSKKLGISFLVLGIVYAVFTWEKILLISTISTSVWLILTGMLLLVADKDKELKPKKQKPVYAKTISKIALKESTKKTEMN